MKDDLELWDEFRIGIESSFKMLFDIYHPQLFNYGHKFSAEDDLLEDCIQELFIKLWRNREAIKQTPSVRNYLFKAFRRILFRKISAQSKFSSLDSAEESIPFEIELPHDLKLISEERLQAIRKELTLALSKMSPRQREIIHLKFFEDMSYEEIAKVMDLSAKSTYKLLYRAIDSLKEHISPLNLLVLLVVMRSLGR